GVVREGPLSRERVAQERRQPLHTLGLLLRRQCPQQVMEPPGVAHAPTVQSSRAPVTPPPPGPPPGPPRRSRRVRRRPARARPRSRHLPPARPPGRLADYAEAVVAGYVRVLVVQSLDRQSLCDRARAECASSAAPELRMSRAGVFFRARPKLLEKVHRLSSCPA